MAMKPPYSGKPCADMSEPRCWGSLITGSLDMCTPDFVPGARREHSPLICPASPPARPPWLARRRRFVHLPLTRRCCPHEEQVLRKLPREHRR